MKFGARGFRGVVTDHDVSTDPELIWHVVFDDGDECDLNLVELLLILLPEAHLFPPLQSAFLSQKTTSPNHLSPIMTCLSRHATSTNHPSPIATFPAVSCPPVAPHLPSTSYHYPHTSSYPLNSPQANHLD
jgi:hypothetical protein